MKQKKRRSEGKKRDAFLYTKRDWMLSLNVLSFRLVKNE